jgi:ornithine carbamoyltransferase
MQNKRDLLSISDFSQQEIWDLLLLARELKKNPTQNSLAGKTVGLIFQKPSTRTTVSFAVGIVQLGGVPLILNADVLQIKRGESPKDTGRVLSRYLAAIVMRASSHRELSELATYASIPVINGLTEEEHPCQVLADLLTIMEHRKMDHPKQLQGFRLSYLGDGNNVAHSWMLAAGILGIQFTLACPIGYEPKKEFLNRARSFLKEGSAQIRVTGDPVSAVNGADAVYTDVWTSMGQESEIQNRKVAFAAYQLNRSILGHASKEALVMHCLPAHRGEEITEEVMEGPNSVIFDQAENRLHVQKAILVTLLAKNKK